MSSETHQNERTDYGGTCDTCDRGTAKLGSRQCQQCEDTHTRGCGCEDGWSCDDCRSTDATDAIRFRIELVDYYEAKRAKAQADADEYALIGRTAKYLDDDHAALVHRLRIGGVA